MRLLAIDSATERLALAAVELPDADAGPALDSSPFAPLARLVVREGDGGAEASRRALPELLALLDDLGWPRASIGAVAFGRGPGGFTGLRTACAVAQGLACGWGVPVLSIDSLLVVAEAARARHGDAVLAPGGLAWAAMDARMDEVYAAAWRWHPERGWTPAVAPVLTTPASLAEAWRHQPPALVAGSALTAFADRLPAGAWIADPSDAGRAEALARLAAAAWRAGEARPAAEALPVYLRDKVALTTAEREARQAARAAEAPPAPSTPASPPHREPPR